jgi:hypothetical protein
MHPPQGEAVMIDLDAAYTILVEECGAPETGRTLFLAVSGGLRRGAPGEYRFQGALGYGGKFHTRYQSPSDRLHASVDCAQEDETPERLAMIEQANTRLAELTKEDEQHA